jgi:uncharacterized protein YceH (UPF0502 family)
MNSLNLSADEVRIIGCLMEKPITTPDQYPLSLNALTNACNQKLARSPVMVLTQGAVQHTTRVLSDNHLVRAEENFSRGIEKYSPRFCNTAYSELQFYDAPLVVQLPRTPGRKDAEYMHLFSGSIDVDAYVEAIKATKSSEPSTRVSMADLAQKLSTLEAEASELKQQSGVS